MRNLMKKSHFSFCSIRSESHVSQISYKVLPQFICNGFSKQCIFFGRKFNHQIMKRENINFCTPVCLYLHSPPPLEGGGGGGKYDSRGHGTGLNMKNIQIFRQK